MNLYPKMLIEWIDDPDDIKPGKSEDQQTRRTERILWIDSSNTDVVIIRIDDPHALPTWEKSRDLEDALASGEATELKVDPYEESILPEEDIPEKYRTRRDEAIKAIKTIYSLVPKGEVWRLFNSNERGRIILEAEKKTGITKKTLYEYLRRYWQGGMIEVALLPHFGRCGHSDKPRKVSGKKLGRPSDEYKETGKQTGINVNSVALKKLRKGYKRFYQTPDCLTLSEAYDKTLSCYFRILRVVDGAHVWVLPSKEQLPSYDQFRYWCHDKDEDLNKTIIAREGISTFNQQKREITEDAAQQVFGPGTEYQIDATVGDIFLLSMLYIGRIIGRPIIYLVVDVFSRMIVGLYVGLEGPSWMGAKLALENAMTDKVAFCKEYGIDIKEEDWPCHHLPVSIKGDWGEMAGYNPNSLVKPMGVRVDNTGVERPDWKPFVERDFRVINDKGVKWLPGATYKYKKRRGKHYIHDAVLTMRDFTKLLINIVLQYNKNHHLKKYRRDRYMIHDSVERYPLALWNYGIQNRVGRRRPMSPEIIRRTLLYRGTASITPKGVLFKGICYKSKLAEIKRWSQKARIKGRNKGKKKVDIAYDPLKPQTIYLRLAGGKRLEPCTFDKVDMERFEGMTLYDILDHFAIEKRENRKAETRMLHSKMSTDELTVEVVKEARKRNKPLKAGAKPSKRAQASNIREYRRQERRIMRSQAARQQQPVEDIAETRPTNEGQKPQNKRPKQDTSKYLPPANPVNKFLKRLEKEGEK